MGVDASIFAKNAKKYIDIDRYYNLGYDFPDEFKDYNKGVNASVVLDVLFETIDGALCEGKEGRFNNGQYIGWWRKIINFLLLYPNDIFFIVTDHDEPCSWDFMKKYAGKSIHSELGDHYAAYEEVL